MDVRGEKHTFWPTIEYRYTVETEEFNEKDIGFLTYVGYSDDSEAEKILDPYPIDAEVDVYYKPGNPGKAVLPGAPDTLFAR